MVSESTSNTKFFQMKISEGLSEKKYGYGVRHIQMICMCLNIIALFIARSSMGVAVLAMTDTSRRNDPNVTIYEWDKKTQGLILSSFFWGYMVMQIPAGLLSNRFGGKPVLLVALLANGFICALLPSLVRIGGWQIVCVCRVMMGLTQACLFPASHTLLGRWLPSHEQTSYSAIVYGGSQIGTIIAMPVSGLLAETAGGWKMIFYTVSGLMLVSSAIWYSFAASFPSEHRLMTDEERVYIEKGLNTAGGKVLRTPWGLFFRTKALWALTLVHMGSATGFILFFVDMPTYLERGLQISLKNSAFLSALPYIGMWVGSVAASSISEKITNRGLLSITVCRKVFNSISFFCMAIGLIALSFVGPENKALAIVTLVTTLTLSGFSASGFMMGHLDLSPNYAGVMLSLTNFAANSGCIVIPIITGFILRNDPTDLSRWRIVFLIVATLTVTSNIAFLILGSSKRQQWDDPSYLEKSKADPEEMTPALKPLNEERERQR